MNAIAQLLLDKLMPDLNTPANLSVAQAILLQHAKDTDAINDLIENSEKVIIDGKVNLSKESNMAPIHNRFSHSEVLTIRSTN